MLGDEIVTLAERRHSAMETFRLRVLEIDELIDEKLQKAIVRTAPDAMTKLEAALDMEINIHEAFAAIEGYAARPNPALRREVEDAEADFKRFETQYRETGLSAEERGWLDRIGMEFTDAVAAGDRIVAITDALDANIEALEVYLGTMDALLDYEIQPLIREAKVKAAEAVTRSTAWAGFLLLVLGAVGLAITGANAWALSRGIVGPIRALVSGTEIIGAGALGHRIEIRSKDEFGQLAAAFNRMMENLARALQAAEDGRAELERRVEERTTALKISEARFKDFAEASADWFWETDAEQRFTYFSDRFREDLHLSLEAPIGKTRGELAGAAAIAAEPEKWRRHFDALEAHQPIRAFEYPIVGDDGQARYLSLSCVPIFDDAGVFLGYRGTDTDVTESKQAETALGESRQRFQEYAEMASDWFWEMDENLRFSFFSEGFRAVTEFEPTDVIGKTRRELTPENTGDERWQRHFADLDAHRSFQDFSYTLTRADGAQLEIRINGAPVLDSVGGFKGYRGTGRDITARVRTEAALRDSEQALQTRVADLEEAQRRLERQGADLVRLAGDLRLASEQADSANLAKSAFLAAMSHELRTPLNAIIGFSEIIASETSGPIGNAKYSEYAKDINDSGQHLLALINDILDLSKVDSGVEELHEEDIEIRVLARSILTLVGGRAGKDGVKLQLDLADDLPALRGDHRKLKQILVNLLSNAIKFTEPGGSVTFKARCRSASGYVFQVIDTGIGIAPEDIPKALSQFGQVDSDLNRRYEGTGLGLPLTKALVELHGGSLDLQSEVGVGTTVTLRFPADRIVPGNPTGQAQAV